MNKKKNKWGFIAGEQVGGSVDGKSLTGINNGQGVESGFWLTRTGLLLKASRVIRYQKWGMKDVASCRGDRISRVIRYQ